MNTIPVDKKCGSCGLAKSAAEFHKRAASKDGLCHKCKECAIATAKKHRSENIEQVRAYNRQRQKTPHGKAAHARHVKNSNQKHSHRKKARTIVNNAIRDGILIQQPCIACGEFGHAHHPNYDAPLDVVWLCATHHREVHEMVRG